MQKHRQEGVAAIANDTCLSAHASTQVSAPQKKPEREADMHAKQVRLAFAQALLLLQALIKRLLMSTACNLTYVRSHQLCSRALLMLSERRCKYESISAGACSSALP